MAIKRNVLAESGATVQAEDGTTMYATIQMRHGKESDMDKSKFVPAEMGVTTDTKKVFMGFAPNDVEEMVLKKDIPDGTTNYEELENLPSIGGVKVKGDKTLEDYGIQPKGNYLTKVPEGYVTDEELKTELAKKLDKNQGAENAGKVLVVGEDGNVAPGETPIKVDSTLAKSGQAADAKTTGDRLGSLAIKSSASGESPLIVRDSAEWKIQNFVMQGKTEQAKTTGAQLFDKTTIETNAYISDTTGSVTISTSKGTAASDYVLVSGLDYICATHTSKSEWMAFYDSEKTYISGEIGYNSPMAVPKNAVYARFTIINDYIDSFMVNAGQTLLPWESYTGGQPSPSPEYPQEIASAGKFNEDTQKWEYEITIANEQTDPDKNQTILLTSDRPLTKWDKLEKRNGQWGWVYKSNVTTVEIERIINLSNGNKGGLFNPEDKIRVNESGSFVKNATKNYSYKNGSYYANKDSFVFVGTNTDSLETLKGKYEGQEIIYLTADENFVPLSEDEQTAMETLSTYYPTTVFTVESGELVPDLEVEYVSDTKTYIDNKFAELQAALANTQAQIL